MKKLYLLLAFGLLVATSFAQHGKIRCYADEYLKEQIRQQPERGRSLEALDKRVDEMIAAQAVANSNTGKGKPTPPPPPRENVVYVPVVVHVVWNTAEENISDNQIASQIEVLNKDYSATNYEVLHAGSYDWSDYLDNVGNAKIQFCLSQVVRKQTTVTSFSTNDAMKYTSMGGSDAINPTTMLNMWSCNMGGDILGYAQFPGGKPASDGVVILYSAFGTSAAGATGDPYDEGRTATHEIGHWFGLRHIWGDSHCGNDKVDDTPMHDGPNYGCSGAFDPVSFCKGNMVNEMWMNYMDYTEDLCMYMFSAGQKTRMDGYIVASRAAYCLSACPAPSVITRNAKTAAKISAAANSLLLYPTMANTKANLMVNASRSGVGEINVIAQSGAIIRQQRLSITKGAGSYPFVVADLPNGFYIIRLSMPDGSFQTSKLIIQH